MFRYIFSSKHSFDFFFINIWPFFLFFERSEARRPSRVSGIGLKKKNMDKKKGIPRHDENGTTIFAPPPPYQIFFFANREAQFKTSLVFSLIWEILFLQVPQRELKNIYQVINISIESYKFLFWHGKKI